MFQLASIDLARFEHSHGEGDWHAMSEVAAAHNAAGADPERSWARGRVFRCSTCSDEIRVVAPDEEHRAGRP